MGWLYCEPTRKALVRHLLEENSRSSTLDNGDRIHRKVLRSCLRGNCLWMLYEYGKNDEPVTVCIIVSLLGKYDGLWGYKEMDEGQHPFYYTCPVSYLDACTEPINEHAQRWREEVRKYHQIRKQKRDRYKAARQQLLDLGKVPANRNTKPY